MTATPTTVSGYSYENTAITYINGYSSNPSFGYGISLINSNYPSSVASQETTFDISIAQAFPSMVSLQFNRTSNSITQLRINYIACDSTFFLDIKITPLDLSLTDAFAISASQRTISIDLPYKTKSNSSNAQIIYNTVGLQMIRTSNTYSLQITMNTRSSNFFSLNLAVGGNNRLKAIRMCSMSYETIATTIDPPFYLNMGVLSGFVGTIPDTSGLTVSAYDTVYTGMVDWTVNDANSVLDFIMTLSGISYSLTTNSLTQTKTAYFWYRKISCPNYSFLNASNQC